jgi:hypothetical protein
VGAVDFGGGDDEGAGGGQLLVEGGEEVEGAEGVDGEDVLGLAPAEGDEGDAAEVEDGVGTDLLEDVGDGVGVAQVDGVAGDVGVIGGEVGADDFMAGLLECADGVAADESIATGDEGFHFEGVNVQSSIFNIQYPMINIQSSIFK